MLCQDSTRSVPDRFAEPLSACELLYGYLQELTRADIAQEAQEATAIRILARADPVTYDAAITAFLFSKPVGLYFTGVA